jgi:hypothetical protein
MNRVVGRNIYIVDLSLVVDSAGGPQCFAKQCRDSSFSAVWLRLGRGTTPSANFQLPEIKEIRTELKNAGIAVWGWHVPQCPDAASAAAEANLVANWAGTYSLDGVLLDAEQDEKGKKNYFLGGPAEAKTYASTIQQAFQQSGRGLALSSHDQPQKHPGFPFDVFLSYVADNCPQLYYTAEPVADRLKLSTTGYGPLEKGRDFTDRYRPVGNITVTDDVPLPSVDICIQKTKDFIALMKTNGFKAYSFWCWDQAPPYLWSTFHATPV